MTGFGGAAVLLPVLVAVFGGREAIPILTVAQLIGNGSRVWFNRQAVVRPLSAGSPWARCPWPCSAACSSPRRHCPC